MKIVHSYFSRSELEQLGFKSLGENLKISRFATFYGKEFIAIGNNVRIDDFAVISTGSSSLFADHVHIGAHSILLAQKGFIFDCFATMSPRSTILGQTDDFKSAHIANATVDISFRNVYASLVHVPEQVVIGTGSTVLPQAILSAGVALGAMSLLNFSTLPWTLYAGIPARSLGSRDKPTSIPPR